MNFTRWSARLPGTQRRAAARTEQAVATAPRGDGSVPAARAERPAGAADPLPPGGDVGLTGPDGVDELPVREVLDRIPALVALVHGTDHRIAYVNDAYAAAFGPRPIGEPARVALPELTELGLLSLLDQVLRSSRPRTVKSRKAASGRSYTFTCTPVTLPLGGSAAGPEEGGGVLVFAADVTDHAEAAERLRTSERAQRETAVTLQKSLLPQELEQPDDLRIAATYQPGGTEAAVGGDWYDVITLGGGRTALVIGDVMGRGVRAAAVMGQLRTAVRAYARLDLPPHEVLQLLDGLATEIDPSQIATCVYAVHDPNEGSLVYASAGHLPILVRDEHGTIHRAEEPTGPPLGTGGWLHTSGSVPLGPGSTAVLYTDGLVERRSEDIDEGLASLERALAGATGTPQVVCDRLIRALGVTADHDDDVAVLVLQHPARAGGDAELFRNAALELLGGVEAAPRARAFATGVLASWRFSPELHDLGVLAASELVANSLQHGTPPMRLRLRRTDRRLIIEVTDGDDHLPRRRRAEPADEAGRGIAIVATIASNWGSRRTPGGGKAVWCEFALPT
ncbi:MULTISPECIES: SpoIIE family protein phosphatase [Streptomyces]|uniref:PAS sensor protein n=1 Tax=Streptomyces venezuelae TaxID=54571 RepID=A0A5P2BC59_STRVZ|nr:SpoIIE family protein phosphatase [Streptomyces venezuelae]MYY81335.1 SpoIIE family protein phosphatase [Streptomyces sp. SID335]MYZ13533.1 SpoIIE family protein phosphatase [Streptomyces sp. SID337]NDZ85250.1 SpoIIE family protein phosphatase [Streptomyces sp. SID10115]NEB44420.1 SpoIIE family protein phosphatase [Streptomyces sp. SID339]QES28073.1 PAS sensor protein [Streptomyces venezuelae]